MWGIYLNSPKIREDNSDHFRTKVQEVRWISSLQTKIILMSRVFEELERPKIVT